uniref:Uncharacterized protein n=1 Tax=viral metagenome TaxID=1070528 RepID=A0A6C0CQW8_9ZZZZ
MDSRLFYSIQAALLFLIISSPVMYNLVQMVFGPLFTVAVKGCPTVSGLLLHTIVFAIFTYLLMVYQSKTEGFAAHDKKTEGFAAHDKKTEGFAAHDKKTEGFAAHDKKKKPIEKKPPQKQPRLDFGGNRPIKDIA